MIFEKLQKFFSENSESTRLFYSDEYGQCIHLDGKGRDMY